MADTLGHTLEEARRKIGRSIADVEADTFIRGRLIAALEQGDYEHLPPATYTRGYIRNYAKFLGLDPEPLLEMYEKETGQFTAAPITPPETVVRPRSQIHAVPPRTALIIAGALAVLVLGIWGIVSLFGAREVTPPLPTPTETPPPAVETTPPTMPPGIPDPSQIPTPAPDDDVTTPETGPFDVRVVIEPDGASWLRVTVDGLVAYEGTMVSGQSMEWTVTDEVSLRIGRPSAVTITRDGEEVEIPPGDPPVVTLTAE